LLSCKSENRYQFDHYSDDHFRERQDGLFDLGVNYESPNKALNAFEDLNEGIVVCFYRLGRLVTLIIRTVAGECLRGYALIKGH